MPEEEVHTRESLMAQNRVNLRKMCKTQYGMTSEECAAMGFDKMVDAILAHQNGGEVGEESKKPSAKAIKKSSDKGAAKEPPARTGRRSPPPRGEVRKRAVKASEPEDDSTQDAVECTDIAEKIDTLGEVVDQLVNTIEIVSKNIAAIIEDLNELRADSYGTTRRIRHMGDWLEADRVLTPKCAPDGLGFSELDIEIEQECSGNVSSDE